MSLDTNAIAFVCENLDIKPQNVLTVLKLLKEEDCTIPFISRYRKEATGGMDEVQVEAIQNSYNDYIEREKRRAFILESIKAQEKLTPELSKKIKAASSLNQLEDIYAPFKNKRKTRGQLAIDAGLQPLADLIKKSKLNIADLLEKHGKEFLNKEKKIENIDQALDGAKAIISEEIVHNVELKDELRKLYWQSGKLVSEKKKDAEKIKDFEKYKDYFEFEQNIADLKSAKVAHRFLAMRRGMMLKILKVGVSFDEQVGLNTIIKTTFDLSELGCDDIIQECVKRAYNNSIHISLDLEIKTELKLFSDVAAIDVFGINLKNLLLQPYLGQKAVIGIDPGIRTGCKVAIIDKNGAFLADTVIYPHEPRNDIQGSKKTLETCIEKLKIQYIAIGNGTFGKETLLFVKQHVSQVKAGKVKAMLVNEDGASIYSASEIARKEFPDKDLTVRGAISIARRFQDPLGELVKIDPKSIGVGQYQHDVNQPKLKESLKSVVENCVNYVGVDLNTASAPLLSYISGIGPTLADNITKHRSKISGFKNREDLLKVSRFTAKVFEQSAGFLRIYDAKNPLDKTFIHPERYTLLESWCKENSLTLDQLIGSQDNVQKLKNDSKLKSEIGDFTMADIVKSLLAPSQDPRTEFVSFEFRNDISDISSIKKNQYYPGLVTNITQFGAFVDIGIKENGLIHVSQMADKFVDNALDFLKVGQEVKARVLEVDLVRKRISLSLKAEDGKAFVETSTAKPKSVKAKAPVQELKNNPFAALKDLKL